MLRLFLYFLFSASILLNNFLLMDRNVFHCLNWPRMLFPTLSKSYHSNIYPFTILVSIKNWFYIWVLESKGDFLSTLGDFCLIYTLFGTKPSSSSELSLIIYKFMRSWIIMSKHQFIVILVEKLYTIDYKNHLRICKAKVNFIMTTSFSQKWLKNKDSNGFKKPTPENNYKETSPPFRQSMRRLKHGILIISNTSIKSMKQPKNQRQYSCTSMD